MWNRINEAPVTFTITQTEFNKYLEQARIEERKKIGEWVEHNFDSLGRWVHGVHYFDEAVKALKQGKLPYGEVNGENPHSLAEYQKEK